MSELAPFEEAVVNMIRASEFNYNYSFYGFLLSQCSVKVDKTMQACAGVAFHHDHYTLYINPTDIIAEGTTKEGKHEVVYGFNHNLTLAERIGILKHEMLHIVNNHVLRAEIQALEHKKMNVAADCAINQDIVRNHLPKYAIYPDNFPSKSKVPEHKSSEEYYNLIDDDEMQNNSESNNSGKGTGDHGKWSESKGQEVVKDIVTEQMLKKAMSDTSKTRGNIPSDYNKWLDIFSSKQVDWKSLLKRVVGNKRTNKRKVLPKAYRRQPDIAYLKGTVKDRTFDLLVVADVSGSVYDEGLVPAIGEVINICKLTNTASTLIQIDTQPRDPEPLTAKLKKFERKGNGGTILAPALDKAAEKRVSYNAVVVITDGYISESDVEAYQATNKRIIWLITADGGIMDSMNSGKMTALKLDPV